jgi:hypothetical protein
MMLSKNVKSLKAIGERKGIDLMRRGSTLIQTNSQTGGVFYLAPGGYVEPDTAAKIIKHPQVVAGEDGVAGHVADMEANWITNGKRRRATNLADLEQISYIESPTRTLPQNLPVTIAGRFSQQGRSGRKELRGNARVKDYYEYKCKRPEWHSGRCGKLLSQE